MRTILFTTLIAVAACATNAAEQPDTTAGGKADGASKPSGTYKNPMAHVGELATLTLNSDGTFSRAPVIECAQGVFGCPPPVETGTYELTHSSDVHFIHFYKDDGTSLDRYQWELADGHLELELDGGSHWFEMDGDTTAKMCGGFRGALCGDGEYCDYGANSCGADDRSGVCMPIPTTCVTDDENQVCGCDGQTHGNACAAHMAGVSTLHDGACTTN